MTAREQLDRLGREYEAGRARFTAFAGALPAALAGVPSLAFGPPADGLLTFTFAGRYYALRHQPLPAGGPEWVIELEAADGPKSVASVVRSVVLGTDGAARVAADDPPRWHLPDQSAELFGYLLTGH